MIKNREKQTEICQSKNRLSKDYAEKKAFWCGMGYYRCPICHCYHLTKQGGALFKKSGRSAP